MITPAAAVAIHDMSGYGRCSLTVALPVLAAMGVRCCPLPTAYLSAHTGFDGFTFHEMTAVLRPAAAHWKALGLSFSAVYSGFLGSAEQIGIVREIVTGFRNDGALALVDPVMGDNGRPYKTYTPEMCARMGELAEEADLITPNLTEAALLLGRDYADAPKTRDGALAWTEALTRNGRRSVVLTGLRLTDRPDCVGTAWVDAGGGNGIVFFPFAGQEYQGTGDLYASVLLGALLRGQPLPAAVRAAAEFVHDCAALSWREGAASREGVRFEALLGRLCAADK